MLSARHIDDTAARVATLRVHHAPNGSPTGRDRSTRFDRCKQFMIFAVAKPLPKCGIAPQRNLIAAQPRLQRTPCARAGCMRHTRRVAPQSIADVDHRVNPPTERIDQLLSL
jgi:hypothetical protein